MKKLPDDPCIISLRKKYPTRGQNPKPGQDIDEWAYKYISDLLKKTKQANHLIREKVPIDDICKRTGLRKETVEFLYPSSRKKEVAN